MEIKHITVSTSEFQGTNSYSSSHLSVLPRKIKVSLFSTYRWIVTGFKNSANLVTSLVKKIFDGVHYFIVKAFARRQNENSTSFEERRSESPKRNPKRMVRILKTAVLLIVAFSLAYFVPKFLSQSFSRTANQPQNTPAVAAAKAKQDVGREFTFSLKDNQGEEVGTFKYMIERAELKDEILVKGQKATAVEGRTFLILTLKIKNEYNQLANINSRDFIRLARNGNQDEWLAPEIHSDPVEVQAISTKYTMVGFPINNSDKDLILQIGEIVGDKETVNLDLK